MNTARNKRLSNQATLGITLISICAGVMFFFLFQDEIDNLFFPSAFAVLDKSVENVVELRERGSAALAADDTEAMEEVAEDLLDEYERIIDQRPQGLPSYYSSVVEWTYLMYWGAEQEIVGDLMAEMNEAVAVGDYEAFERALAQVRAVRDRLNRNSSMVAPGKFTAHGIEMYLWTVATISSGEDIVEAQLPPESGQVVWGEVPVFPGLVDIPIAGGLVASAEPLYMYESQPKQAYYNIPPNSSLWDAITTLTPVCSPFDNSSCYEVSAPEPKPVDSLPSFITFEGGQLLEGAGITSDEPRDIPTQEPKRGRSTVICYNPPYVRGPIQVGDKIYCVRECSQDANYPTCYYNVYNLNGEEIERGNYCLWASSEYVNPAPFCSDLGI